MSVNVPLAPLESLPIEIISEIFIYSQNPSLALVSRQLMASLSFPRNQTRLGISMLSSDDANVHSDLLARRFVTFDLYDKITHAMPGECGDDPFVHQCSFTSMWGHEEVEDPDIMYEAAHFNHPFSACPPARLFHNIAEPDSHPKQLWKIMLLRRLYWAGLNFGHVEDTPELQATALEGLQEALILRNVDAVSFLTEYRWNTSTFAAATPAMLVDEIVSRDCDDLEMANLILRNVFFNSPDLLKGDSIRPHTLHYSELHDWIYHRKIKDERTRRDQERRAEQTEEMEHSERDTVDKAWVGLWVQGFVNSPYDYTYYLRETTPSYRLSLR
ncbi:MAG: hypothetical protein M1829_001249 [Trizodia sp. TS-e1964]|nr:MAG: hypothetical protein M1829_001249 [Trizodia sp. TS-e1964]